jgi:tripartite-type tricarboxylate transporter receptor subunit TctC
MASHAKHKLNARRHLLKAAAALPLLGWPFANAADFPTRPIKLIIPFPPGGIYYTVLKIVTDRATADLGQPFVLEHKAGAGTTLGTEMLAKSPADGYTVGVLGHVQAVSAAYYRKLNFDLAHDLVSVAAIAELPTLILASPNAPFKTLQDMISYGKSNPGKLTYGAATSYAMDLLQAAAGVDYLYVPYKGHPEALSDLLSGRIDLSGGPATAMIELVKAGRVRPLTVMANKRMPALPDVPAAKELLPQGFVDAGIWISLAAPKGLPDAVLQRLSTAFNTAMKDPAVLDALTKQGLDVAFAKSSPQQISARLQADYSSARKVAEKTQNFVN